MTRPFALTLLAALALSANADNGAEHDAEALRAQGAAGLHTAMATGDDALIDAVAGQRDARWSGLFWHTDIDDAKAEAARSGKPILSLRLLGDLRDEYTCANSRFFRSTLYSNPEVSQAMNDGFVLHWSSERDVPEVTIDYGDGRIVHRTITGNSIHYVLDADGRPIDAIPGLYGAGAFQEELSEAVALHASLSAAEPAMRTSLLQMHHGMELAADADALVAELAAVRGTQGAPAPQGDTTLVSEWMVDVRRSDQAVAAVVTMPVAVVPMSYAVAKSAVEMPALIQIDERAAKPPVAPVRVIGAWTPPTEEEWTAIGARHASAAELHDQSVALMRAENPLGTPDDPRFGAMMERLEASIAEDTARNTYLMAPSIHAWFAGGQVSDFESFNRKVYDELFLTPAADPWLGMVDELAYSGLVDGGLNAPIR